MLREGWSSGLHMGYCKGILALNKSHQCGTAWARFQLTRSESGQADLYLDINQMVPASTLSLLCAAALMRIFFKVHFLNKGRHLRDAEPMVFADPVNFSCRQTHLAARGLNKFVGWQVIAVTNTKPDGRRMMHSDGCFRAWEIYERLLFSLKPSVTLHGPEIPVPASRNYVCKSNPASQMILGKRSIL